MHCRNTASIVTFDRWGCDEIEGDARADKGRSLSRVLAFHQLERLHNQQIHTLDEHLKHIVQVAK
jgi:hypothetical protein